MVLQARRVLERVRGTPHVAAEFEDMRRHAEAAQSRMLASRFLILQRQYRPQLVLSALCTFFQLWTGRQLVP